VRRSGYAFRPGPDVLPRAWVPREIDYAALGHVHRHQRLRHPHAPDLPLVYSGSTERTSRAERGEEKGFVTGLLAPARPAAWRFTPLPAVPLPERPRGPRGTPWPTPTGN
jgi:DNA repair exonuclease SbcCD nuclease subunit